MDYNDIDFCKYYIQMIVDMFRMIDEDDLNLLESSRDSLIENIIKQDFNIDEQNKKIIDINNNYDKQLFELLKVKVADNDPYFFNEMIKCLNNLMLNNDDCVKRLNMISPNDKKMQITDYYDNYIKALEYFVTNVKE